MLVYFLDVVLSCPKALELQLKLKSFLEFLKSLLMLIKRCLKAWLENVFGVNISFRITVCASTILVLKMLASNAIRGAALAARSLLEVKPVTSRLLPVFGGNTFVRYFYSNSNKKDRNRCLSSSAASTVPELENVPVTLIQGDGVYPEILDSVQSVLRSVGAPIDFEPFFLSDIHAASSAALDEVVSSVQRNGVCKYLPTFKSIIRS